MPKFSIITAVRNSEKTIADCIECVAGQTADAEHILIDGASIDGTMEIVEQYNLYRAPVI